MRQGTGPTGIWRIVHVRPLLGKARANARTGRLLHGIRFTDLPRYVPCNVLAQDRLQFADADRLEQVMVDAGCGGPLAIARERAPRDGDDGHCAAASPLPQLLSQTIAIEVGQTQVKQNNVGLLLVSDGQRLRGAKGGANFMLVEAQQAGQRLGRID
jgi:hypothetical protein